MNAIKKFSSKSKIIFDMETSSTPDYYENKAFVDRATYGEPINHNKTSFNDPLTPAPVNT